ncbi:hypothetical protein OOK36_02135 [Streptomyces sp. NBC_00365]|uniref:hypothetical protein n=1 Tax=Streptomyces sp. NBC_00365 TaxID=2975726 RepID=UPI0022590BE5|nr:hypothetical protein [Streptomyces sp. NBC_00365]MCX5087716.1 hypothetical protein [Streptomyces sp. NBC_00365]
MGLGQQRRPGVGEGHPLRGALFKGGLGTASSVALPDSRAGVLAMFFVSCYAGMGVPPVLFSIVLGHLTIEATVIVFAAALSVGAALAVVAALRTGAVGSTRRSHRHAR